MIDGVKLGSTRQVAGCRRGQACTVGIPLVVGGVAKVLADGAPARLQCVPCLATAVLLAQRAARSLVATVVS